MRVLQASKSLAGSAILAAIETDVAVCFDSVLTTEWLPGKSVGDLLYHGRVHGLTPAAFHERCDGKGATLTLIRADTGSTFFKKRCVFGGYTGAPWGSVDERAACPDAFLFSVVGPHCTMARFPLRPGKEGDAVYHNPGLGPCFGHSDLVVSGGGKATDPFDGTSHCRRFGDPAWGVYTDAVGTGPRTFTGAIKDGLFKPVDIEVYAIV